MCTGDGRGDACATDYDGDGVDDSEDVCPLNGHISRTSFFDAIKVRLDKSELEPSWDKISVSVCFPHVYTHMLADSHCIAAVSKQFLHWRLQQSHMYFYMYMITYDLEA